MQRLLSVNPDSASGPTQDLLNSVEDAFGSIPNVAKVMANSPAVLQSFLGFATAMREAKIGEKLHNQLKLNTSEANSCHYCTSILTAVAPSAGLSADEILAGRTGNATDQRTKAALTFAQDVRQQAGRVDPSQLAAVREAGFDDGEIVEIVASVVLGSFTNLLNNVADTELDVPRAAPVPGTCSSTAS
jgi:uncharacterized peroxidase-related enzyme